MEFDDDLLSWTGLERYFDDSEDDEIDEAATDADTADEVGCVEVGCV